VSIDKLREIHDATHPARLSRDAGAPREDSERSNADLQTLVASLAAEVDEEVDRS
jgi:hypothetical protein